MCVFDDDVPDAETALDQLDVSGTYGALKPAIAETSMLASFSVRNGLSDGHNGWKNVDVCNTLLIDKEWLEAIMDHRGISNFDELKNIK